MWEQTGEMPVELEVAPCPDIFIDLWHHFRSIEGGRQFSESGLLPLSWSDIWAWCGLMGVTFSNFELNLIKRLDFISIKRKDP